MKAKIPFILVFILLFLASCSQSKQSTKLEISRSFTVANSQSSGGIMVHGESTSGKKFTLALDGVSQKTILLDPEVWSFHAIGWSGPSKFSGTPSCASVISQDVSQNSTVVLDVSPTNCSNSQFKVAKTKFLSCQTFYKYNQQSDQWTDLTAADPNTACTEAPFGFRPEVSYSKIIAYDTHSGKRTKVLESSCLDHSNSTFSQELPLEKFPFEIRTFRTYADCVSNSSRSRVFNFPEGLQAGRPSDFDHLVQVDSYGETRIVLPASITRRGKSPFTNMMPNILCGIENSKTDCIPNITDEVHVNVPWGQGTSYSQMISRNAPSACPATPLKGKSKYFTANNCSAEDNNWFAQVRRKELTCQAPGEFTDVIDIAVQGEYVFLLKNGYSVDEVWVYKDDALLMTIYSNSNTATHVAAIVESNALNVYLITDYKNIESHVVTLNDLSHNNVGTVALTTGNVNDITATNNALLFVTSTGKIGTRTVTGTTHEVSGPAGSSPATQITHYGPKVFFIQNNDLYVTDWDGINIGYTFNVITTVDIPNKISATQHGLHVYSIVSDRMDYFSLEAPFVPIGTHIPYGFTGGISMAASGNKAYLLGSSGLSVSEIGMNPPSRVNIEKSLICDEDVAINGELITFKTSQESDVHALFDFGISMFGVRNASQNMTNYLPYLFHSMNDERNLSSGGALENVRDTLSASSISGLLSHQYSSCEALDSAVNNSPVKVIKELNDPIRGESIKIDLTVTNTSETIPSWICSDTDPGGASCVGEKFDLRLDFTAYFYDGREKGRIYLKCGKRTGRLETLEIFPGPRERKLASWNTESHSKARFEALTWEKESQASSARIISIAKNGTNIFASRYLETNQSPWNSTARVHELELATSLLMTKGMHLSDETSLPNLVLEYPTEAGTSTFLGQAADSCINNTDTSIYTSSQSCSFSYGGWTTINTQASDNSTLDFTIEALSDLADTNPAVSKFFTLE